MFSLEKKNVSVHVSVCLCVFVSVSLHRSGYILVFCVWRDIYTQSEGGKYLSHVYMHTAWFTTHTYTLFINILFSINNFSSLLAVATKYYFLIISINNLIINSWLFIILTYIILNKLPYLGLRDLTTCLTFRLTKSWGHAFVSLWSHFTVFPRNYWGMVISKHEDKITHNHKNFSKFYRFLYMPHIIPWSK